VFAELYLPEIGIWQVSLREIKFTLDIDFRSWVAQSAFPRLGTHENIWWDDALFSDKTTTGCKFESFIIECNATSVTSAYILCNNAKLLENLLSIWTHPMDRSWSLSWSLFIKSSDQRTRTSNFSTFRSIVSCVRSNWFTSVKKSFHPNNAYELTKHWLKKYGLVISQR
jgi:hypothetical protein